MGGQPSNEIVDLWEMLLELLGYDICHQANTQS